MPLATVNTYLQKLEIRQTEMKLLMTDVVSLPTMKKRDRMNLVNGWMKLVNIRSTTTKLKPASLSRLKMIGIGVRHE